MSVQLSLFGEETDHIACGDAASLQAASEAPPSAASLGADPGAWIQLRRQALDLFQRDYGYRKVASLLGISVYTVREWARAYRKGEFTAEPSRRFYSAEEQVRIAAMSKSGRQPAEIARLLQIPVRSVRSILARNRGKAGAAD